MGGRSSELMRSDRYRKIIQIKKEKCERSGLILGFETWFWSEILIGDKHHGRKLDATDSLYAPQSPVTRRLV